MTAAVSLLSKEPCAQDLTERAVHIKVQLGRLGNTRRVHTSHFIQQVIRAGSTPEGAASQELDVDTDQDMIRVSKSLLDSNELKAILSLDSKIHLYLYSRCLPFEPGIHLLPIPLIEEVEQKLHEFARQRSGLVAEFLDAYPQLCEQAAKRLRRLYDPGDYPGPSAVRSKFYFTWQYIAFGVPAQLREISGRIWKQEQEKASCVLAEASAEIQQVLRAGMAELVSHMRDRLTAGPDGKPRIFKESTVRNLREFVDTFDIRNITGDEELKGLVERARALLHGVTTDEIRNTATLRASIQVGMSEIAAKLDEMTIARPTRKFRLDEA